MPHAPRVACRPGIKRGDRLDCAGRDTIIRGLHSIPRHFETRPNVAGQASATHMDCDARQKKSLNCGINPSSAPAKRITGFMRSGTRDKLKLLGMVAAIGFAVISYAMNGQPQARKCEADRIFGRAAKTDFRGDQWCAGCHAGVVKNFPASPHAAYSADPSLPLDKRGCEGCHGAGNIHQATENGEVIAFRNMTPKESSAACMRCHAQTLSENHWKNTEHARADLSCVSCHKIHPDSPPAWELTALKKGKAADPRKPIFTTRVDPKRMLKADEATLCGQCHAPQVGEFRGGNHHPVPEGKMVCSDCHNPHPSKNSKVNKDPMRDACATCHTERAGPFVYEHDPVAGTTGEGCVECHRPHGANNPKLLSSTTRGLCGKCHTDQLASHFPGRSCYAGGCHVSVHGSNTSPLLITP